MQSTAQLPSSLHLLTQLPTSIAIFDTGLNYLATSAQWLEVYDLTNRQIIGQSHYDVFPEINEDCKSIHRECMLGAMRNNYEEKFTRTDGSTQWLKLNIKPWVYDNGAIGGIIMCSENITQQKKSEEYNYETNKTANIGSWEFDVIKQSIYWSAITKQIHEVPDDFAPDLEAGINFYKEGESREIIAEVVSIGIQTGKAWDVELQIITAKGNEKWVRAIGKTEFSSGKCVRLYGTFQDIDEWKLMLLNTKHFAELVEASDDAIVRTDLHSTILTWNTGAATTFGYTEKEIVGQSFNNLLPPDILEQERWIVNNIKEGKSIRQFETKRLTKDHVVIDVSATISPIKNAAGIVTGTSRVIRDITIQKQKEIQYKKISDRLLLATKAAGVGIWDYDIIENKLVWDDQMCRLYGIEKESFTGVYEAWQNRLHPDDRERGNEEIGKAINGENDFDTEFRVVWPDGNIRNIRAMSMVKRNASGEAIAMIGTNWDITEIREAEELLEQSEEQFRGAFEHSAIGMALVGPKGQWINVNESLCNSIGYSKNELLQLTFQHITYPDDLNKDLALLQDLIDGKINSYTLEKRYYHKKGHIVWVTLAVSMVKDGYGQPLHFVSQIEDITEKKLAQQKLEETLIHLEAILDATTQVSIIGCDVNGIINMYNKGAQNMLGYTSDEMLDKQDPVMIHDGKEVQSRAIELSALFGRDINGFDVFVEYAKQGRFESREWTYIRKDGTTFPVQLVVTPLKNINGEIEGFLGIAVDITVLKEAEKVLKQNQLKLTELNQLVNDKNKELSASNAELEQFAYIASHDLQEPLRMITGFLSLLESRYAALLDDKAKSYINFAVDGANRMKQIITDILTYSRIGRIGNEMDKIDIGEMLTKDLFLLNRKILETGAVIEWHNLPVINAAKAPVQQLFMNLISNGLKYQAKGNKPVIKISHSDDGDFWKFAIKDNGIGIEERYFDKVFTIFQRLHNKEEYSGTGIGLAICKKTVLYHKGQIWLESKPGIGTTFFFTIKKNL